MPDETQATRSTDSPDTSPKPINYGKPVALGLLVVLGSAAFWFLGDRLSIEYLAAQETTLRNYHERFPLWTPLVVVAIYVAVAGFSIPGASVLTLACGWYFGFWEGLLVVSVGSTAGATLAFLMTRYMLQGWVQRRFTQRLEAVNAALDREGAFYLFTLRLIPAVPFFVINAVMGLTKIRVSTFWWVSQLGMLPGTAAYVYAGTSVPSLQQLADKGAGTVLSWRLLLAFAILGALPLVLKKCLT